MIRKNYLDRCVGMDMDSQLWSVCHCTLETDVKKINKIIKDIPLN